MIEGGCVKLAPHALVLLRFGPDRRLVVEPPSREEIVADALEGLAHER